MDSKLRDMKITLETSHAIEIGSDIQLGLLSWILPGAVSRVFEVAEGLARAIPSFK